MRYISSLIIYEFFRSGSSLCMIFTQGRFCLVSFSCLACLLFLDWLMPLRCNFLENCCLMKLRLLWESAASPGFVIHAADLTSDRLLPRRRLELQSPKSICVSLAGILELVVDGCSPVAVIMCTSEVDKIHTKVSLEIQQLALNCG